MYINFSQDGEDSYCSIGSLDEKLFRVYLKGSKVSMAKGVEGTYPLDSYSDSLKTIMRSLFEAQLLRDWEVSEFSSGSQDPAWERLS